MSNPADNKPPQSEPKASAGKYARDEYSSSSPTIEQETVVERLRNAIALFDQGLSYDVCAEDGRIVFTEADFREAACRIEQLEAQITAIKEVDREVMDNYRALLEAAEAENAGLREYRQSFNDEAIRQAEGLAQELNAAEALSTSYRKALEEIAAFRPVSPDGALGSYQRGYNNGFNCAGRSLQVLARQALSGEPGT